MLTAKWFKLASSSVIKRSSQTLSVVGNRAYIYGGELRPREPVDTGIHSINITAAPPSDLNSLDTINEAPPPRVGATSTTLMGKIYYFSGRGGIAMAPIEEHGGLWEFDPVGLIWSLLAPLNHQLPYPAGRSYHAMTSNEQDIIYVHAGCPATGRLNDLWAFNLANRRWEELPSAPGPQRGGASLAFARGKLYRMNGFDGKTELGGSLDVFDLASHKWRTISYAADGVTGPSARSVCSLSALNIGGASKLVTMFGESDPSNLGHNGAGKMLQDAWVFDIDSSVWAKLLPAADSSGNVPAPRGWFDTGVYHQSSANPSIVLSGGLDEANERIGDIWSLEIASR